MATASTAGTVSRSRDSAATRAALLTAASDLFSNAGYDKTTIRDIGERAGVDPALIARYFGNKVNLYLATLTAEASEPGRADIADDLPAYVTWLLARTDKRGPGPLMQALVRSDTAPEIREAARAHITRRLVDPLADLLERQGAPDGRLRAETAIAALIGVLVVRGTGSFEQIGEVGADDVAPLLTRLLQGLLEG